MTTYPLRVNIVGSGVLVPDDARRSAGHWVSAEVVHPDARPVRVLLDCGSGTLHGMARDRLPWAELTHIVLSHFHTDHIGDLAPILWALRWGVEGGRREPLDIVGPEGLAERMRGLAAGFGSWLLDPGFPLRIHEVAPGAGWTDPNGAIELVAHRAHHSPEALAWRLTCRGTSVGYTGDTGPLPELASFFRDVTILIAECSMPDPPALDTHLSPSGLADLARDARPKLLVPVHLYPGLDPDRLPDLLRAAGYSGPLEVGKDGLSLDAGPDGATPDLRT